MLKVFFLIAEPGMAWGRIAQARRGFAFIVATYLLPMILLGGGVEGWGLMKWGKWQGQFQRIKEFTANEIITYEIFQTLLLVAMVYVSALVFLTISQTFQGRHFYRQAFTVMAYGFSPLLLFRLLDAGPMMNPWVTWGLGIVLTIWILYQGIPRVLLPDPSHAFGLYLAALIVVVMTSGLTRLLTAMYLLGWVDYHNSWLTRTLSRFHQ
jgi:hypothetical protein